MQQKQKTKMANAGGKKPVGQDSQSHHPPQLWSSKLKPIPIKKLFEQIESKRKTAASLDVSKRRLRSEA